MEFKDYYKTLGVAREASEAEIKKAFRKLARQHHPDHAGRDNTAAEEKFKEINEAYEVLSDPEKRRRYDQLGSQWNQPGGMPAGWEEVFAGQGRGAGPGGRFAGTSGQPSGFSFNFGGTGFSDFFEAFFSGGSEAGNGRFNPFSEAGNGFSHATEPPELDVETDLLVTLEEANAGAQRNLTLRKTGPGSELTDSETIRVRIPAGIRQGQRIRVPQKGRGDATGRRGDLFLRVRLEQHPDFRVDGSDLIHEVELAPWDAALGLKRTIPTLAQRVTITMPPGTQSGRKFRLKGLGLQKSDGSRGDLYAVVQLTIPAATTDAQRQAWQALRDSLSSLE
ncbi:MAG: DnaJ C-terminal domain-containing protein [Opitutales bacterium]